MNNVGSASADVLGVTDPVVEDRLRRFHLLRASGWIAFTAFSVFIAGYLIALFFVPDFPILLIALDIVAILSMLVVARLLARGNFNSALLFFTFSLTLILFLSLYFINGARGPIVLTFPLIVLVASEVGGQRYARITVVAHVLLYVAFILLESLGVITPYQMPEFGLWLIWVAIFIVAAVIMLVVNQQSVTFTRASFSAAQKREESLVVMSQRAEAAALAERTAQQQALRTAQQLQEVVQEYATYLERIAAGDYSASLDLSALAERPNLPPELLSLGQYVNTTVASLVTALDEAQKVQQTYTRQSWEDLMQARRAPAGYRYRADGTDATSGIEVDENAWLPPMTQTVRSRDVTVGAQELALPIASGARAQLIGALGVRREQDEPWSEDELALVTTVTDQLAQTLENLRLLDETTRRAAREQMAGEITGRIREAVEIEAVLERALSELGRAVAAERGTAYLALSEQEETP